MAGQQNFIKQRDPVKLTDILWSVLIGVVQLEESKTRATVADHFKETLRYAFEMLTEGM